MNPRGLRNNNPLNIRHSTDLFQGEVKGTDRAFKTFISMPYGYRAAFVILATYHSKGYNTIEKIVTRWAPPNENNTAGYIANVEKWSGVTRNKTLTLSDGGDYIMIVAAMSFIENGKNADISEVRAGFNLQTKIRNNKGIYPFDNIVKITILAALCLFYSCRTPQYIPIETIKTEYRDKILRDSIYLYDSIYIKEKGDTVIFEQYRYLYRDKLIRDSVFINDTIRVPYPVEVIKQAKRTLSGWQNFQVWCGRFALIAVLCFVIYFLLRLKKF